ncbi:CHASE2 domain-containing protein [candidate division KSB1 bacterium]|nr:CHASE2 domain-containing protein [candidate division KSB1 bacterium]
MNPKHIATFIKNKIAAILFAVILFSALCLGAERLFHHSFEKFLLGTLQRIDYKPQRFSNRILIIDTSPLYDLSIRRTHRGALAELLGAIKLGQPGVVGLDIRLEPDSLYRHPAADSVLGTVISDWENLVVPAGIDPVFGITDSSRLANILIHEGYEIPTRQQGLLSLPLQMFKRTNPQWSPQTDRMHVKYDAIYNDLVAAGQCPNAVDILSIYHDPALSLRQKQDQLGMMLASQFVFVGMCNSDLNIDMHQTPFGIQPGLVIWANSLNNILRPHNQITYFPLPALGLWLILSLVILFLLDWVYVSNRYFFAPAFIAATVLQGVIWLFLAGHMYFSTHTYIPVFSFTIAGIGAFPVFLWGRGLGGLLNARYHYIKLGYLPPSIRNGYKTCLESNNAFKQIHIAFTLVEECIRFSALLGLAQAFSRKKELTHLLNWQKHVYKKLTFGQWQHIMRELSKALKDENDILIDWKQIYYDRTNKGEWQENKLKKALDSDLGGLMSTTSTDLEKRQQKIKVLQEHKSGLSKIRWLYLKLVNVKTIQNLIRLFGDEMDTDFYKTHLDNTKTLIGIRNKMAHDRGVFMQNQHYETLFKSYKKWLDIYFEKLGFWKNAVIKTGNSCCTLRIDGHRFDLEPFFLIHKCDHHLQQEFFMLYAIDDSKQSLHYSGKARDCKLTVENAEDQIEEIFSRLRP